MQRNGPAKSGFARFPLILLILLIVFGSVFYVVPIPRKFYMILAVLQAVLLTAFTHAVFAMPIKGAARRVIYGVSLIGPLAGWFIWPYGVFPVLYLGLLLIPVIWAAMSAVRPKRSREAPYNALYLCVAVIFILWYPVCVIALKVGLFAPGAAAAPILALIQCVTLGVGYASMKRREELEEKAESSDRINRMKAEFLQNISHELSTPLTVIAMGIDFADDQIKRGGAVGETLGALEIAREETQRVGRMVRGLLYMAEISEDGANRKRTDFQALLRNSAEIFRIVLEKQDDTLRLKIAPGMPDVFVEADKFSQVMTNLLSNAANHTRGGQVSISAGYDKSFIAVRVTDNGEGISPELLPRVFMRGVSGRGGTGYGLYICKTIVEAHGGTIGIESEPGGGTTVIFTVPVYGGQEEERDPFS